jgi:hypothetical protein
MRRLASAMATPSGDASAHRAEPAGWGSYRLSPTPELQPTISHVESRYRGVAALFGDLLLASLRSTGWFITRT